MMRHFALFTTLCSLLLFGCAGAPQKPSQPDWITGESATYPQGRYLVGIGQAEHQAVARERARADLARNFEVRVSEQSEDLTAYTAQGAPGQEERSLESRLSRQTTLTTDQVLQGSRVAESWRDPASGEHYALAVLDRLQAGMTLRQNIAELDAATVASVERARGSANLLEQIRHAKKAYEIQRERTDRQRYLQVVDPAGVGVAPIYTTARLRSDLEALLGRVRIAPQVEQASADLSPADRARLATVLAAGLTSAGFYNGSAAQSDYTLAARLQLHAMERAQWHWLTGELEIVLHDKGGKVQGAHRWPIKVAAQEAAVAHQRAMEEAARVLKSELQEVIIGFTQPE